MTFLSELIRLPILFATLTIAAAGQATSLPFRLATITALLLALVARIAALRPETNRPGME
ncbi:hypothetical protein C8R45DRAFT_986341 [Mycena sanguinolenta]|nr:hypothetical protein C8R45DRAFT_986341 [Mycena sanguinolenta]